MIEMPPMWEKNTCFFIHGKGFPEHCGLYRQQAKAE